ncbi:MAG TPA: hypothetical protein VK186_13385, partial [Candidatus Deferrimicrobium sp.]|nr:hypothetical protein [Candidatus Deferrimicrobium sp.]
NTGVYPAGQYTLVQHIRGVSNATGGTGDGSVSTSEIDYEQRLDVVINPTEAITAKLEVSPLVIPYNMDTTVQMNIGLKNAGNVPLDRQVLTLEVMSADGKIIKSEDFEVTLALSGETTDKRNLMLNLTEGVYQLRLKFKDQVIAEVELKSLSSIKSDKVLNIKPRVFLMNLNILPSASMETVATLLQMSNIEYKKGQNLLDSYFQWHNGYSNISVVSGGMMGRLMRDELKERVWRGESVIVLAENPIQSPDMVDFLGVRVKPVPGNSRETLIRFLPTDLFGGGDVELPSRQKLGFEKSASDVIILAETAVKKIPVAAYRKYGKGDILIIALPFQFKNGAQVVSQLLMNAVTRFSHDIYTISDITRLLPIDTGLTNKSDVEKKITVKEILPSGVEGFEFNPRLEGEELKWQVTIPGKSKKEVSYWLHLPDKVNSYEVKTELYDGESKLEDVTLTFEVNSTVVMVLNELATELWMVEATGKDAQNLTKAEAYLSAIRNRSGEGVISRFMNLSDAIHAARCIAEVNSVNVSAIREKVQNIVVVMGRRFYDGVTAEGPSVLDSILSLISGE